MLVTILDTIKSAYAASESKIALKYHLELVKEAEIDEAKENIKELQKEMSEACFKVIQTRKYFLWKGTIALPVMPFDIEVDQNAYFILSIYSDDIEFNNKDIDFFYLVVNLMEKLVDLHWYKDIVYLEDTDEDVEVS